MPGTHAPARLVLAGLCTLILVACGSSGSSSSSGETSDSAPTAGSSPADAGGTASMITIEDFTFTTPDSVSPGATITVDNKDGTAHTVTADEGDAFDDDASPGTSTFTAPTDPGSYPFHCSIHPSMHGTLVVK
jgi:plastocyanin